MNSTEMQELRLSQELLTAYSELKIQCHTPTVSGRFIAAPGLISGTTEVNNLIHELREMLAHKQKDQSDDFNEHLLELWIIAERCLLKEEINELRPAVFKRLFGDNEAQVNLSRDGQPQIGGISNVSYNNALGA